MSELITLEEQNVKLRELLAEKESRENGESDPLLTQLKDQIKAQITRNERVIEEEKAGRK